MDSFPMILACFKGQTAEGGTDMEPRRCENCNDITYITNTYCALCCLREELGLWKRPEREVYVWP